MTQRFDLVNSPMRVASTSCLSHIFLNAVHFAFGTASVMRSWDSESHIRSDDAALRFGELADAGRLHIMPVAYFFECRPFRLWHCERHAFLGLRKPYLPRRKAG